MYGSTYINKKMLFCRNLLPFNSHAFLLNFSLLKMPIGEVLRLFACLRGRGAVWTMSILAHIFSRNGFPYVPLPLNLTSPDRSAPSPPPPVLRAPVTRPPASPPALRHRTLRLRAGQNPRSPSDTAQ